MCIRDSFETVSQVEQVLRQDPVGLYGQMDFETRDHYRKVIEELALGSQQVEGLVAQIAVQLAENHVAYHHSVAAEEAVWAGLEQPRLAHVGYYLLDKGRDSLEKQHLLGMRFGVVILDEAHKARTRQGFGKEAGAPNELLAFMREIAARADHVLLGTATPIQTNPCLLYTSPSPRDRTRSRMPSSA